MTRSAPLLYTPAMAISAAVMAAIVLAGFTAAQESVSFSTQDGGLVYADVYGKGERGVVLAHGGGLMKESWEKQGRALAEAGFRTLALDFRGEGQSRGGKPTLPPDEGRHFDVLAAVRYLRKTGAKSVAVVGASMGGDYAAEAAEAEPDAIDRLVLLAAGAYTPLIRMRGRKLFIMSRDDIIGDNKPRLPKIREQYEKAAGPKEFVILDGSAHAQRIFATDQGERLMREILRFISAP
jgi:pimeloyl-ACP methyl ester carboxylesterase